MKATAGWVLTLVALVLVLVAAGGGGVRQASATSVSPGTQRTVLLPAPREVRITSTHSHDTTARSIPFLPRSLTGYEQGEHSASTGAVPGRRAGVLSPAAASPASETLAHFPVQNQPGQVSWFGQDQNLEPPDTQLASSGGFLAEATNSSLSVWSETGAQIAETDLNQLFDVSSFSSSAFFADPRLLYDSQSQRWFLSGWAADTTTNSSRVYLAVSAAANPSGGWYIFTIATESGTLTDEPSLGIASDKVVLSWNDFDEQSNFTGAEVAVLQESGLLNGVSAQETDVNEGTGYFSIVPAQSLSATTTEWMAYDDTDGGPIGLISVTGTPAAGDVTLTPTTLTGTTTALPPAAAQPGGTIATDDDRFESAVWQNGDLWVAGNDGCTPSGDTAERSCLRLIEASASASGTATVTQNFDDALAGSDLYYPAVTMDGSGDMFVAYSESSSTSYPGVYAADEVAGTTSLDPALTIQTGQGTYSGSRWGDYSAAAPDPSDPAHVWVTGEYSLASDEGWGTATGEVVVAPAISSVSPSSGAYWGGTSVTITGRNLQPGATVTFGTTAASSISVVSSTEITAVTNPGYGAVVSVTVTNPDGSSATASNAFTFDPAPYVSYFSWFDRTSNPGFKSDNIHVVNPTASVAQVMVDIPGNPGCSDYGTIAAGGEQYFTCSTGFGGPVTVNANQPVIASQRVQYYQSFNEVTAQTANQAQNELYFTWFDRVSNPGFYTDNIHVIDPGSSAADVSVSIPGCSAQTGVIAAGTEQYFTCAKGFGGPVTVTSTNNVPVLASQRVQYYQSFNEVNAQSAGQAQDELYFAWFDRVSSPGFYTDNVHVMDPGSGAADVSVSIPGCSAQTGSIPAGGEQYFTCAKGFGGPVTVTSTNNVPVLASQRVQYYQSFNEVSAQPASAGGKSLYFTWFDRVSSPGFHSDNVHVINPGSTVANVTVAIPGCSPQTGAIPAGGEQYFTCASGYGGPVTVTSDQSVLASQRVQYYQSFNEVTAMTTQTGT